MALNNYFGKYFMPQSKYKNKLEKDLEKLSWEFVLDADNMGKDENEIFLEENYEDDTTDFTKKKKAIDKKTENIHRDLNIESLYGKRDDLFLNINELNRNSSIIFDEKKLQANKITEWTKAPRLREPLIKKALCGLLRVLAYPGALSVKIIFSLSKNSWIAAKSIGLSIYRLVKMIVSFPWQILLALRASFIYLFGDLSWISINKTALADVMPNEGNIFPYRRLRAMVFFVFVALVLVLPIQGYVLYKKSQDTKGHVMGASLEGIEHMKLASALGLDYDFSGAGDKFRLAENDFLEAERSFGEFQDTASRLSFLIPEVKSGRELLEIAKKSAQIGIHLSMVADALGLIDIGNVKLETGKEENELILAIDKNQSIKEQETAGQENNNFSAIDQELKLALGEAMEINDILGEIDLSDTDFGEYQGEFENIKKEFPRLIAFLDESKNIFKIITYFLGSGEPRRWMLVFENNRELRPTGGFMGSYAILDVKDGKIKNIEVPGGGFYDLKGSMQVKVDAPYPFHLFSPIWQPWNANWFPNWPDSARKIAWFYENSGGATIDGVIAFTPKVLEDLLALTGEIVMPEYETAVNSENFVRMAQMEVEIEYDKEENKPKKFIGYLLPKVIDRIFSLKDDRMLEIFEVIGDAFMEKHLLVYFYDNQYQELARKLSFAGEIKETSSDYLSVVHTNIAGGKTDMVMMTNINHKIEIMEDGSLLSEVIISKKHNGSRDDIFEGQRNIDYLRVYVPLGAELLEASGFDKIPKDRIFQIAAVDDNIAADNDLSRIETNLRIDGKSGTRVTDEFGKTVFGNWMIVGPGEEKSAKVKYLLPFKFAEINNKPQKLGFLGLVRQYFFGKQKEEVKNFMAREKYVYSLLAQKQAGTENDKIKSEIVASPYWEIANYLPKTGEIIFSENGFTYASELRTDRYYGVEVVRKQ